MTDVNELNGGADTSLRANGFACLKELDYWMNSSEHMERYHQKFPGYELNEFAHHLISAIFWMLQISTVTSSVTKRSCVLLRRIFLLTLREKPVAVMVVIPQ